MDGQVKKMVLVPADLVARKRPVDQQLTNIEQGMQDILSTPGLPADVLMKLYGDALARYDVKRKEAERPLAMAVQQKPTVNEDLLASIPKSKTEAGEAMLKFLRDTPTIQWNERKELVLNGAPVAGTNLVDLFNYVVRDLSNPPVGHMEFLEALHSNNVPQLALGNKRLRVEPPAVAPVPAQFPVVTQSPAASPNQYATPNAGRAPPAGDTPRRLRTRVIYNRTQQSGKGFRFDPLFE